MAVIQSAVPREPPGWPDLAAVVIRSMSRRTCVAMVWSSEMFFIILSYFVIILSLS